LFLSSPRTEGTLFFNVERAQRVMEDAGVDVIIATSPENVTYTTGYTSWTIYTFRDLEVYGVAPASGSRALIVPIDAADYLAQRPHDGAEIYTYGTFHVGHNDGGRLSLEEKRLLEIRNHSKHQETAVAGLRLALEDRDIFDARIGLDERGLSSQAHKRLRELLKNHRVVAGESIFRTIRMIKTEAEIDRLRYAGRAVQAAILAAFAQARPGMTETDLETTIRTNTVLAGLIPGHCETSAGTRAGGNFPPSDAYRLQIGDVIRSDCGGRHFGYWADTGRSAVIGDLPPKLERYYAALRTGISAMLELARPGLPVSELAQTGLAAVRENGITDYKRHHVGHAIGLEMYEAPLLTDASGSGDIHQFGQGSDELQSGMVLNIELPYYELGLGGLQIEDTIVIRPDGCEALTIADRGVFHCAERA
jgi:Xaa-Pro dipeptidase